MSIKKVGLNIGENVNRINHFIFLIADFTIWAKPKQSLIIY
jgi:hypothetical protein